MKLITLYIPEPYLEALNQLVEKRMYPSRSHAIREAVRDLITEEVWRKK